MADGTYIPKVYRTPGGDSQVVASGGSIKIETGGKILPNSGTQAANIVAATGGATGAVFNLQTKFNSLLAACKAVGILATS